MQRYKTSSANRIVLPLDVKRIIYDKLSMNDIHKLMSISYAEYCNVAHYLDKILSNPDLFFRRLFTDYAEEYPVSAMMLLNRFYKKYEFKDNPIKNVLETNGQYLTALFDRYVDDGKALSIVSNAVSRICDSEKLRQLRKRKELSLAYYALVTGDVRTVNIPKLVLKYCKYQESPSPLAKTFYAMSKCMEYHERLMINNELDPVDFISRELNKNECFPINLSGLNVKVISCVNDLTLAILKNMHGEIEAESLTLYAANLQFDKVDKELDQACELWLGSCDLRYAFMIDHSKFTWKKYALVHCNLEAAIIFGCHFSVRNIKDSQFRNSICTNVSFGIDATYFQEKPIKDWQLDPNKYFSITADNKRVYFGGDFQNINLNLCRISSYQLWVLSSSAVIKRVKNGLLDHMYYSINKINCLDKLATLVNSIFMIDCHLLKLRRTTVSDLFRSNYKASQFTRTKSWRIFINIVKKKAIQLMLDEKSQIVSHTDTLKWLRRLGLESGSLGLFDNINENYKKTYEVYEKSLDRIHQEEHEEKIESEIYPATEDIIEQEIKPTQNIAELIKKSVKRATDDYCEFSTTWRDNRGVELGFFTKFRHGESGRLRAKKFSDWLHRLNEKDGLSAIIELLSDKNTRYHNHSFATYLLDNLKSSLDKEMHKRFYKYTNVQMLKDKIISELYLLSENSACPKMMN